MLRITTRTFTTTRACRAGHSKWQNIKHKKARNDKERSAQNTRIAHQITVAAKEGGGTSPEKNIRLATMIETALKNNLSKKVIESAIERASPSSGSEGYSITYEGAGPGGVAFIVSAITDNKNRTAQNVRAAFTRFGASIGPCAYLFQRKGYVVLSEKHQFDDVFEQVLDVVEDVEQEGDNVVCYITPSNLSSAASVIKTKFEIEDMGLSYIPEQSVELTGEALERTEKLIAALESVDDVHSVETNLKR